MQRWLMSGLITVAFVGLGATTASGWGSVDNCMGCHSGFRDGDPSLHDLHVDNINDCGDCHQASFGDPLSTNNSANYAEYSCNGCHTVEGLANFHINGGLSTCGCHSGVAAPASEGELPFFYTDGRSSVVNTCRRNATNGGEDWDGDGEGLDNDADGLYDVDDPDCAGIVPVDEHTWSTLKDLFELD